MSGENETRTALEECICAVMAEACYIDGGTPKDFMEMMRKDPVLKGMYDKVPYIFKSKRAKEVYRESIDVYVA